MNQKLIAFWKYDLPPYILSGEVLEFGLDGTVRTSMGRFRPIAILPDEAGEDAAEAVEQLRKNYQIESESLRLKIGAAALDLIGLGKGNEQG